MKKNNFFRYIHVKYRDLKVDTLSNLIRSNLILGKSYTGLVFMDFGGGEVTMSSRNTEFIFNYHEKDNKKLGEIIYGTLIPLIMTGVNYLFDRYPHHNNEIKREELSIIIKFNLIPSKSVDSAQSTPVISLKSLKSSRNSNDLRIKLGPRSLDSQRKIINANKFITDRYVPLFSIENLDEEIALRTRSLTNEEKLIICEIIEVKKSISPTSNLEYIPQLTDRLVLTGTDQFISELPLIFYVVLYQLLNSKKEDKSLNKLELSSLLSRINVIRKIIKSQNLETYKKLMENHSHISDKFDQFLNNNRILLVQLESSPPHFRAVNSGKGGNLLDPNNVVFQHTKCHTLHYSLFHINGTLFMKFKDEMESAGINKDRIRVWDKEKIYIKDNALSIIEHKKTLTEISSKSQLSRIKMFPDRNNNIGSFDLETYRSNSNSGLDLDVYAIGFKTTIDPESQMYYLTDLENVSTENPQYDSNLLIKTCLDRMLTRKYHKFIFYAHNFGRYDFVFLYRKIKLINKEMGFEYFKTNCMWKSGRVIKLTVSILDPDSKSKKGKEIRIHFVDSFNFLSASLESLCKDFELTNTKSYFPYGFVNNKTLLYEGTTPDIKYYPKLINQLNIYQSLIKPNWNMKEETLAYLNQDLICLLEIMTKFSKELHSEHQVELTKTQSISGLALNIFFNNYYKPPNRIPKISDRKMFNYIREGYFGGTTEVYKPYGKDIYGVDINSLYPDAALSDLAGLECSYFEVASSPVSQQEITQEKYMNLDNLFGFLEAEVQVESEYFGLLPYRVDSGVISPNGTFKGIWFSEELKLAEKLGAKIRVKSGYIFNIVSSPFKEYVCYLYKKKNESTGVRRLVYKSLLNNLLGRFGININKEVTRELTTEEYQYLSQRHEIVNVLEIGDTLLTTYDPHISEEKCIMYELNYAKEFLKHQENSQSQVKFNLFSDPNQRKLESLERSDPSKEASIVTAAMVTGYARMKMTDFKLRIQQAGGTIYYTDTDSLFLDKIGYAWLLNNGYIGKDLGQFKLEHICKEAHFISNKTYCLTLDLSSPSIFSSNLEKEENLIIKSKGVPINTLTKQHMLDLFNKKEISIVRNSSKSYLEQGYVDIFEQNVVLNPNAYTKRNKVFDTNTIWIDTKPVSINSIDWNNNDLLINPDSKKIQK